MTVERHTGQSDTIVSLMLALSIRQRYAEQECNAFHKRTGRIIKLLTVQEILDEEYVQKM